MVGLITQERQIGSGIGHPDDAVKIIDAARSAMWSYLNPRTARGWFDAEYSTLDANNRVAGPCYGWLQGSDKEQQILHSVPVGDVADTQRPTVITSTNGKKAWSKGSNSFTLFSSDNCIVPTGAFSVAWVMQQPAGANGTYWIVDNDSDSGHAVCSSPGSDNRFYFYSSYSATNIRTNTGVNDGNPHLFVLEFDGLIAALYIDGTLIAWAAPAALSAAPAGKLRLGTNRITGSAYDNVMDGYIEWVAFVNTVDPIFRARARAIALNDHPGWTIAA